jgi:hypothetical protein
MAEWLGHLMSNWPTFLIGVAVIIIFIIGATYYFYVDGIVWRATPNIRRKTHGKK